MTENEIATIVVDAAFKIHKTLGQDYWNRYIKLYSISNYKSEVYELLNKLVFLSTTRE